ncbi:MAG: 23S rRNA (uracil(1939)-C(5))-methyltransferase RlmD [Endomicrobiales bacterium]
MKITVEKIVYPGTSLGRGADGIATFVEGCLPGEAVEVTITRNKKTFREGKLAELLSLSPERIAPRCPSFGTCGGCSFQHAAYKSQVAFKEGYVKELLAPLGVPVSSTRESPAEWEYRNKMEFSFFNGTEGVTLGLHEKNEFDRFFPVPPCFLCDRDFSSVIETVTAFARASGLTAYNKKTGEGFFRHLAVRKGIRTGQVLVNIVTNKSGAGPGFFGPLQEQLRGKVTSLYWTVNGRVSDVVQADELILLDGKETIEEELAVGGRTYSFNISPFSFFQTNTRGTEVLYDTVLTLLKGEKDDVVFDLYCGTGTIGIILAPFVKEVLGVEQIASAVENAVRNQKKNGIENISFTEGSVEKWIKHGNRRDCTTLVMDPPRGGINRKVVEFLHAVSPRKILYVSCNPSTLARDLKDIVAPGTYRIKTIIPVDMFPQTYHIETVVSLEKIPPAP